MAQINSQLLAEEITKEIFGEMTISTQASLWYLYKKENSAYGDSETGFIKWMVSEFKIGDRITAIVNQVTEEVLNGSN